MFENVIYIFSIHVSYLLITLKVFQCILMLGAGPGTNNNVAVKQLGAAGEKTCVWWNVGFKGDGRKVDRDRHRTQQFTSPASESR